MDKIRLYIEKWELPPDKLKAKKLKHKAIRYTILDGIL